ncbi:unnamed protein product, partial [Nesidiocoris tenuis]
NPSSSASSSSSRLRTVRAKSGSLSYISSKYEFGLRYVRESAAGRRREDEGLHVRRPDRRRPMVFVFPHRNFHRRPRRLHRRLHRLLGRPQVQHT